MSVTKETNCPSCGALVREWKNPVPTVDIIIEINGQVVLIERKNEPFGWAIPGGYVDYGETLEVAAAREAMEETGLTVVNLQQFGAYSDPARDPRQHNISVVFTANSSGVPSAGDDAATARLFNLDNLPELVFDHAKILADYLKMKEGG